MIIDPAPLPPAAIQAVVAVTVLSAAFAVKHLAADFLMQTSGMARGKERAAHWFAPLASHVLCHAALTLLIVLAAAPRLWWLAAVDFAVHIAVDRCKTVLAHRGRWTPDRPQFWWLLGLDQCLHQLTNVGLAAAIVLV